MITITLTIKENNEGDKHTTDIDCQVAHDDAVSASEAQISNIINNAARTSFEDYLRANPGGGNIVQRARKGTNGRSIKPEGF